MSSLIPSITITEFKKLHARDIKGMKSVEVYSDGEHLCTVIIPKGDSFTEGCIKVEAEELGMRSNIAGGVDPKELSIAAVSV